ncbi:acyl-CoA N-acyltransferase [Aspergillus pseudodeflectus]|uniref:Acyl-CoA N-acyltransferase n=1 Tax=Aspergillus pseudodeflectus TaxID=176178 RepID=A0ABR4JM16_9EURO
MLEDLTISDIHSLGKSQAFEVLAQITRVEKKTFPSSEAFQFGEELWRKKPNTRVLYVTGTTRGTQSHSPLVAYAVYARQKGVAWVHKVCVAEVFRGNGVGTQLMEHIRARLQKEGCQFVYLWVDKAREHARSLYLRTGFEELEELSDYYAPGRNGIKMVLDLQRGT